MAMGQSQMDTSLTSYYTQRPWVGCMPSLDEYRSGELLKPSAFRFGYAFSLNGHESSELPNLLTLG